MKITHGSSVAFPSEAVWKYTIEQESAEAQRRKMIDSTSGVSAVPTGLWLSPTIFPTSSVPPFLLFNAVFSNQAPFLFSNGLSAFSQTPSAARMN